MASGPSKQSSGSDELRKPDFFIVGAPKCGTTSLYAWLSTHPEVFLSPVKEPYYFCPDIVEPRYPSERDYLELFSAAGNAKRVGEASTWYLYSEEAAGRIHDFNPEAGIIILLRDPVGMLESLHNYNLLIGQEDESSLERALALESERAEGRHLPAGVTQPKALQYRQIVSLSEQASRYLQRFGREQVHLILLDDLMADPAATYRGVLDFLGVNRDLLPDFSVANAARRVRFRWLREKIKSPPAWLAKMVHAVFTPRQRQRLVDYLHHLNAQRGKEGQVDAALRSRLKDELAGEVAALERLLNRPLADRWGYNRG